jgi:hypothetical protein
VNWMHLAYDRDQWQAIVNTKESLDSIKGGEFLDYLIDCSLLMIDCSLLKKASPPCRKLLNLFIKNYLHT